MSLQTLCYRFAKAGLIVVEGIEGVKPVIKVKMKVKPRRVGERWTDNQGTVKKKTTQGTHTWSKTHKRWIKPDPIQKRRLERKRKGGFGTI